MKFLLEQFGAAIGIAQIFGGVALRGYLQADSATLERRAQIGNALPMGVIERLRNAENRRQAPCDPLIVIVQRRIRHVMPGWNGFAIVIAHQRSDDGAVACFQARDIAVEREVFAVFVVPAMADHVPDVVEQRARLQQHAGLRG